MRLKKKKRKTWKMTENLYSINEYANAGRFRRVTVTEHPIEILSSQGGLTALSNVPSEMVWEDGAATLSATVSDYSHTCLPAYTTYVFEGGTHNYFDNADHNEAVPSQQQDVETTWTYAWEITGEGAEYLALTGENTANPTLTYVTHNTQGHKWATLTLTVTYREGVQQSLSANVLVKTQCQNPMQASAPVVTYEGATVSWYPTAEHYKVYWKKVSEPDWSVVEVGNVTSYTLTGLEYNTPYLYKVAAICDEEMPNPTEYSFTTKEEPGLLVYGAVFGGSRMAKVGGNTEVVIVNCDSISAVYGGNDITSPVVGSSNIILGINAGDDNATYGVTNAEVRIGDVYGGGNGFYAYNGTSFEAASSSYDALEVAAGSSVLAMTPAFGLGEVVWTNEDVDPVTLAFPTITSTSITVSNDYVKVDSIFGGAKNAFLTTNSGNGSSITFKGGTAFAVFGGNNIGGTQGYGKHYIEVNKTKTNLTPGLNNTGSTGYGRDFGIRYLFGGGNKVYGSTTDIQIHGGQCDTVFGGGNAADVYRANVNVACAIADGSSYTYGDIYTQAISSYSEDGIGINEGYRWDGSGVYNVRTLFGGNNMAPMASVPNIFLTSGSIGTAYGGGNAGDMLAQATDNGNGGNLVIGSYAVKYGTHIVLNSPMVLVDYLYGGCQMANVDYSTWVEIKNGHVGTVYGGCNVSGDVGSTRVDIDAPEFIDDAPNPEYQEVYGSTNVVATGGTVHHNLFAGSNGYYHCNNGIVYIEGVDFGDPEHQYLGMTIPTHNETHVVVSKDEAAGTQATIEGNVYAGGNLACVGFINASVSDDKPFPKFVGWASVHMDAGTVEGSVYGGGNMASVYGSNDVLVSGGTINGALYGGNDRTGQVAQMSNRVLPEGSDFASDGLTPLDGVKTYVHIIGNPLIDTVYGGGNGAYNYENGDFCLIDGAPDYPIQTNTFVDIHIENDGHINTVFGGGKGVSVNEAITVFLNVNDADLEQGDHVGTIYGGNNMGDLALVPNIILLNGKVNTVYGGCNSGAMTGNVNYTVGEETYSNVGSLVRLRDTYQASASSEPVATNAVVSNFVYGGCRSNGVDYNTLVLVEGGTHPATFFGGSDVSGDVSGTSQVIVTGGATGTVYGGGNGNYDYSGDGVPPYCASTDVEIHGGTCTSQVFGGGFAGECGETNLLINGGSVAGTVFGGGNQAGVVYEDGVTSGNSTIIMTSGTVADGIYGGCNANGGIGHDVNISITNGVIGGPNHRAVVFGGGYGQPTTVAGDVMVTFGDNSNTQNEGLVLYGDLYGGSALGSVNTNGANQTTVNVYNGTIAGTGTLPGNVFGGGLGSTTVAPAVNGVVRVNIGGVNEDGYFGLATLTGCNVFGCNNLNGSPQDQVFVDVYQTVHTASDVYTNLNGPYAIHQVFGGGNQTDYAPADNPGWQKLTHVHVHGCENTIEEVFGASNAADADGVHTIVDGGRFNFIYGGGNGIVAEANVLQGGTYSQVLGGHTGWCFGGSNRLGNCYNIVQDLETVGDCGPLVIDYSFSGGNIADQTGDVTLNFDCDDNPKSYRAVYGGCRLGTFYGNITINIRGGRIGKLFGGCQGYQDYPAHVKKYDAEHYPVGHPELIGTGGNITINLYGGAVGDVFGGCDEFGNVEGKITINVNENDEGCHFFVGNIYGASNQCDYKPIGDAAHIATPEVNIINGTIGGYYDVVGDEGEVESYEGNVFGGCNLGNIISSPLVLVGPDPDKTVLVKGNVYGGGNEGDIEGSPKVTVVPTTHSLSYSCVADEGSIRVVSTNVAASPATLSEGASVVLLANPAECYVFDHWQIDSGSGVSFTSTTSRETLFTMGTTDASITAVFASAGRNTLTITPPNDGSFIVRDRNDQNVSNGDEICQFAELVLEATPAVGYAFKQWIVTETESGNPISGALLNPSNPNTIFTMGNEAVTITAEFEVAYLLTITSEPESGGTITVTNQFGVILNGPVYIAPNTILTLKASPNENYTFGEWIYTGDGANIPQPTLTETSFSMGTGPATIRATFTVNEP